jgi:hypothetical protein
MLCYAMQCAWGISLMSSVAVQENHTVVGTTDDACTLKEWPAPEEKEVEWILQEISRFLERPLKRDHVNSIWTGIRPLARYTSKDANTGNHQHSIASFCHVMSSIPPSLPLVVFWLQHPYHAITWWKSRLRAC